MGWYGSDDWTTREKAVDGILARFGTALVAHRVTQSGLWTVSEDTDKRRHLVVHLLESLNGDVWSEKPIHEGAGPFTYDCPLEFLDLVPALGGEISDHFRSRVRGYHAELEAWNARLN